MGGGQGSRQREKPSEHFKKSRSNGIEKRTHTHTHRFEKRGGARAVATKRLPIDIEPLRPITSRCSWETWPTEKPVHVLVHAARNGLLGRPMKTSEVS